MRGKAPLSLPARPCRPVAEYPGTQCDAILPDSMCAFSQQRTDAHATCPNRDFTETDNESGFAGKYIQGKKVQIKPERYRLKEWPTPEMAKRFRSHVVVLGLVALVALAVAARGTRLELPSEWRPFNTTRLP